MSDLPRRDFMAAAGVFTAASAAALLGSNRAEAGDPSFMNNVPDPILSGKELPSFKFELEKSQGKVIGGSYGKEATVEQLPISKGIAGVSMMRTHSMARSRPASPAFSVAPANSPNRMASRTVGLGSPRSSSAFRAAMRRDYRCGPSTSKPA